MDEILRAFDSWVLDVGDVAPQVRDLLRQLLTDRGVVVHSVEARAKARSSLARKVATHTPPYASLRDVTDVLGARIITYFPDEVDVVGQVIEREFTVDLANSHDRRATIEPERFGYMSVHYVVTLSPARETLAEWKLLAGWPFEIQVRSLLQHAWAEIEHDLGFHTAVELPRDVRRRWSRVAALLETADTEFVALRAIAAEGVTDGQERPTAHHLEEVPDAISWVAVGSAGNVAAGGLSVTPASISIVLARPARTVRRQLRVALETPDVVFEGTPTIVSQSNVIARLEPGGRIVAVDLESKTGEQVSIAIVGLRLMAGQDAPPGPVQASIAIDRGGRRPIASPGTVVPSTDILAVVRDFPTLRLDGRNQIAGRIIIVELAAGTLMSAVVLRLRLVEISNLGGVGATFEARPMMVVRHGDIVLRDGDAPSTTGAVLGTVGAEDASCAEWIIWTASTTPSTLEVGDAAGPRINVGSSQSAIGLQVETVDREGKVTVRSLTVLGFPTAGE